MKFDFDLAGFSITLRYCNSAAVLRTLCLSAFLNLLPAFLGCLLKAFFADVDVDVKILLVGSVGVPAWL